jgi:putative transposase
MDIRSVPCHLSSMTPSNDTPLPSRKRPSRNSVRGNSDNRPIVLFVTVNAARRQRVFDHPAAMDCLLDAWRNAQDWLVSRYMIMPDHVHLLCVPGRIPVPDFHRWMKYWKGKASLSFPLPHSHPLWQRQCWDTQLRCGEHFSAKWEYIRANPVRKGLVAHADDWPFQGTLFPIVWLEH